MPRRRPRFSAPRRSAPVIDATGTELAAKPPTPMEVVLGAGPPRRARARTEAIHQERVIAWLRARGALCCHVPNGGHRSPRAGAALKRLGVTPGVPDVILWDKPPNLPGKVGTAFEMKPPKGGNNGTKEQREWLAALAERGWHTAVYKGATEAIFALEQLGY